MAEASPRVRITGDGNIVGDSNQVIVMKNQYFTGKYERLRDAYIEPWSIFERVSPDHFVGREWLLAEIDDFLQDHDRGYFILEADAGLGKTTFLAWLVQQRGYIHHFTELAPGLAGVGTGLKNLAAQLALACRLDNDEVGGFVSEAATRPDYLSKLLKQASDQRRNGQKIVLVMDALDEAGTPHSQNVLGLPEVLPEGVFIIASQRPVPVTLRVEATTTPRHLFRLSAGSDKNKADMRHFLEQAATWPVIARALNEKGCGVEQFVEMLLRKCGGVWIYLHYVVHEIEQGERSPLDLDSLPDGMIQYYLRHWQHWRNADEKEWYRCYLPLLSTLAAVREPVSAMHLADYANVELSTQQLHRLLNEHWRAFIAITGQNQQARYRFYHNTLRRFFHGRMDWKNLTASEEAYIEELAAASQKAHERFAERYFGVWGGLEAGLPRLNQTMNPDFDDRYGLRHLVTHLVKAGCRDKLHHLLTIETPDKCNAWYTAKEAIDDAAGYIADIQRAWEVAEAPPLNLGKQVRYALIASSLTSLVGGLSPKLMGMLLQHGIWTQAQALAYIARIPSETRKIEAIAALCQGLKDSDMQTKVEAIARKALEISHSARSGKMCLRLMPYLPNEAKNELSDRIMAQIRGSNRVVERVQVLCCLIPYLSSEKRQVALKRELKEVLNIKDEEIRARALAVLGPHLPSAMFKDVLLIVKATEDEKTRAQLLSRLAPHVPCEILEEAVSIGNGILDVRSRISVLARLAVCLPTERQKKILGEALILSRSVEDKKGRDIVLSELTHFLALSGQCEKALAATQQIENNWIRGETLARISTRIPEDLSSKFLEAIKDIKWMGSRARALRGITLHLRGSEKKAMLMKIEEALEEIDDDWIRAQAFIDLVPHLPPALVKKGLKLAWNLDSRRIQTKMLEASISHLPPDDNKNILKRMTKVFWNISDYGARAIAIAKLACYLPSKKRREVLAEVLENLRALHDCESQAQILGQLGQYLPTNMLHEAWEIARDIELEHARAEALVGLLSCFSVEEKPELVIEALDVVERRVRPELLIRLMSHLAEIGLHKKAITLTMNIEDDSKRGQALVALLPHVPPSEWNRPTMEEVIKLTVNVGGATRRLLLDKVVGSLPEEVLEELLESTAAMEDNWDRRWTLIELAPHLSENQQWKALEIAQDVEWERALVRILSGLAPHLSSKMLHEALTIAWSMQGRRDRLEALLGIIPHLSQRERESASTEMLELAGRVRWGQIQHKHVADTFLKVISYLSLEQQRTILSGIYRRADSIERDILVQMLSGLAMYLPMQERKEPLELALTAAYEIEEKEGSDQHSRLLSDLASCLFDSGYHDEAIGLARTIRSLYVRRRTLTSLGCQLIELGAFDQAIDVTRLIQPRSQAKMWGELASQWAEWSEYDYPSALALWSETLRTMATHSRPEFLSDLKELGPVLLSLGGAESLAEAIRAIQDVGRWWP